MNVIKITISKNGGHFKRRAAVGRRNNRITTTSRRSKQVPACVSNIALIFGNISIVCTNKIFNCCTVLISSKLKFAIELQAVYLRCTTYLRMPLFGIIPVVTLFVVCAGAVNTTHTSNNNSQNNTNLIVNVAHLCKTSSSTHVHLLDCSSGRIKIYNFALSD